MIPKIIHWCWFGRGELPPLAKKCIASWKEHLSDYEIKVWNEDNFDVNSVRYVAEAYQKRKYAFVSDYVRLSALHAEGGIYMDTDVEVLKRLDRFHELPAFTGYESDDACGMGMLGSEKGGRWVKDLMDEYQGLQFIKPDGRLNMTTIVKHAMRVMKRNGMRLDGTKEVVADYVTIFPRDYFYPRTWKSEELVITENTHTIHHYAASWWGPRERCIHWTKQHLGAFPARCVRYFWRPLPVVVRSLWPSVKRRCGKVVKALGSARSPFVEFLKYSVVGGVAFVADFGTLVCAQECFFKRFANGVYFAVILGFVVGIAVNYALSLKFVFTRENYAEKGRSVGAFLVFGLVGGVGLALTELGMWVGIDVFSLNYMVVKIFVTGLVLVWNYLGRKVLVFGAKGAS